MSSTSLTSVLRLVLPVAVTGALLVAIARLLDGPTFAAQLAAVRPEGLVLAAAMVPLEVALAGRRWQAASASLGVDLEGREAFAETGLATLLNQLLPSGLAGEAVRVWRQRTSQRPWTRILGAVMADRGLGLATFAIVLVTSLLTWPILHPGTPPAASIGAAGALTLAGGMVLVVPPHWPRVGPLIDALRHAVFDRRHPHVLVATSFGFLATIFVQAWLCAWSLSLPAGATFLTLLPLYLGAMLVPLSVGGWGPKEVAALSVFPLTGWTLEEAAAFSTVFGLSTLLGALPFTLVAWRRR